MLVKIFKSNGIGQFVFFAVAALLLWGRSIVSPPEVVGYDGFAPLYEWLYRLMVDHTRLATLLALVLTVVESLWVSNLLYNYKLVGQNSLLPALLYLTMMGCDSAQQTLTPHLIVNGLLLFYLDRVMLLGVPNLHHSNIFDSSAAIALAAMFYSPALLLLVPHFVVLAMYKQYSWRDWAVMLLGFMAPTILLALVLLLSNDMGHALFLLDYDITSPRVTMGHDTTLHMVTNGLMCLLLLVALAAYPATTSDLAADSKKDAAILAVTLVYGATQLLYTQLFPVDIQLVAPAFAFVLNGLLIGGRRRLWIYDLTLVIFLLTAIL